MTDRRSPATEGDFRTLPQETSPGPDFSFKLQDIEGNNKYISQDDLKTSVRVTDITATGGIKERVRETADGFQKTWTLQEAADPPSGSGVFVFSNGRLRSEYTVNGADVTFEDAPVAGVVVEIISFAPATAGGPGGSGTVTQGANVGTSGVGVYDGVSLDGTTLNFRNVVAANNTLQVFSNTSNKTIELSVLQNNLSLGSIGGGINDSQHGNRSGGALHALANSLQNGFISNTDFDKLAALIVAAQVPTGGNTNDALVKQGPEDYNYIWAPQSGGGSGGHIIIDNDGNALPQAPELQFLGGSTAGSDASRTLFDISQKAENSDLTSHTGDTTIHLSAQQVSDISSSAAHTPRSDNPHNVTAAQIGVEAGAQVNTVDDVFGLTGSVTISALTTDPSPLTVDFLVLEKSAGGAFRKIPISAIASAANAVTKSGTVAADQVPIWTTDSPPVQTGTSSFRWTASQFVSLNYTFGHDQPLGASQANYVMMYKRDNGGPGVHEIVLEPMDLTFATNNLPVARLNDGTNATPDTYWAGDGTWKTPPGAGGGEANTTADVGTGTYSIRGTTPKTGVVLNLKTIEEGSNITIDDVGDVLTINSTGGGSAGITGTTPAPSSIPIGGRWTSPNITLTNAEPGTHSIVEMHVLNSLGLTWSQEITSSGVGVIEIYNNTTSVKTLTGDITVIARQVA